MEKVFQIKRESSSAESDFLNLFANRENSIQAGDVKSFVLDDEDDFQVSHDFSRCTAVVLKGKDKKSFTFAHLVHDNIDDLVAAIDELPIEDSDGFFIFAPKLIEGEEGMVTDPFVNQRLADLSEAYTDAKIVSYPCTDYYPEFLDEKKYPATSIFVKSDGVYFASTNEDDDGLRPDLKSLRKVVEF